MANSLGRLLVCWGALIVGAASASGQPFPTSYHAPAGSASNASPMPTPAVEPNDNVAPPGLLIGVLIMLLIILLVIAVGVVLALCIIGIIALLVFCGVLSTSLLIGVKDRKVESAARALFVQFAALSGMAVGCAAFWLAAVLFRLNWSWRPILIGGVFFGLLAGMALGLTLNWIWMGIRKWILARKAPGFPV